MSFSRHIRNWLQLTLGRVLLTSLIFVPLLWSQQVSAPADSDRKKRTIWDHTPPDQILWNGQVFQYEPSSLTPIQLVIPSSGQAFSVTSNPVATTPSWSEKAFNSLFLTSFNYWKMFGV
jgi:hypothetical protein